MAARHRRRPARPNLSNFDAQSPRQWRSAPVGGSRRSSRPTAMASPTPGAQVHTSTRKRSSTCDVRNSVGRRGSELHRLVAGRHRQRRPGTARATPAHRSPTATTPFTATPRNRAGERGRHRNGRRQRLHDDARAVGLARTFLRRRRRQPGPTRRCPSPSQAPATFRWKVVDRTATSCARSSTTSAPAPASRRWQWDGKDNAGAYVPDGTYYSVMTTATSAGTYCHRLPVEVRAFRLTTRRSRPGRRGAKVKFIDLQPPSRSRRGPRSGSPRPASRSRSGARTSRPTAATTPTSPSRSRPEQAPSSSGSRAPTRTVPFQYTDYLLPAAVGSRSQRVRHDADRSLRSAGR